MIDDGLVELDSKQENGRGVNMMAACQVKNQKQNK
jgi:hypothetical protein